MSQRLQTLTSITAGAAHSFNNLIGVILGNVELAALRVAEGDTAAPLHHLDNALATLARARGLADLLLGITGQTEPFDVSDPNAVVSQVRDLMAETLDRRIEVRVQPRPDVPAVPLAASQLRQVLLELAWGMAQALPRGGTLSFETEAGRRADTCGLRRAGRYAVVVVRTTADDPAHRAGSAPGSAGARAIAEGWGGWVDVHTSGEATAVSLWLPNAHAVPAGGAVAAPRPLDVLIVDDEAGIRDVTRDLLEGDGYSVRTAATGSEAMAVLRAAPLGCRVVLMDNQLGDGRGVDLLTPIAALPHAPHVVIVTGMPGAPELQSLPPGVSVLVKPYLRRHLHETFAALGIAPY